MCSCPDVDEMFNRLVDLIHSLIEANTPYKSSRVQSLDSAILKIQQEIVNRTNASEVKQLQAKLAKMTTRLRVLKEKAVTSDVNLKTVHNYVNQRLVTRFTGKDSPRSRPFVALTALYPHLMRSRLNSLKSISP